MLKQIIATTRCTKVPKQCQVENIITPAIVSLSIPSTSENACGVVEGVWQKIEKKDIDYC
jgi:hypothetical protein